MLGTIEQVVSEQKRGPFVGIETSHAEGMTTVVLDYGTADSAEQIHHGVLFETMQPRVFVFAIPQVAVGRVSDSQIRSLLQFENPFLYPVKVRLNFLDPSGARPCRFTCNSSTSSCARALLSCVL